MAAALCVQHAGLDAWGLACSWHTGSKAHALIASFWQAWRGLDNVCGPCLPRCECEAPVLHDWQAVVRRCPQLVPVEKFCGKLAAIKYRSKGTLGSAFSAGAIAQRALAFASAAAYILPGAVVLAHRRNTPARRMRAVETRRGGVGQ